MRPSRVGLAGQPGWADRLKRFLYTHRMAKDITRPDPAVVLDLLEAFRRSKTMFAAVALGVFDALETRPRPVAELAADLHANADALG